MGSLGTTVYNHLPISTTQEHFWGPALFLPPCEGPCLTDPGEDSCQLFSTSGMRWLLLPRRCCCPGEAPPPRTPSVPGPAQDSFSWLSDFSAAFIGPQLCLVTSQDGMGCLLELAKHPSQNTEGSTSVLATLSETSFSQYPPTRSTLSRIPSIFIQISSRLCENLGFVPWELCGL